MEYRVFNESAELFLDSFFKEMNLLFSKNSFFFEIDDEYFEIYNFLEQFFFIKYGIDVLLLVPFDDDKGVRNFFYVGVGSEIRSKGWKFNETFSNEGHEKITKYFSFNISKPHRSHQKEEILESPFKHRLIFYELFISLYNQLPTLKSEILNLFLQNDESKIKSFNEISKFFEEFNNATHKINGANDKIKI